MKLILGGVRGTNTVADAAFMKYGGDTTSFLIEGKEGATVVVDVGTGVRVLDRYMREHTTPHTFLLLMTHYHLDHIAGFPSFSVLYDPAWSLEIAAPHREGFSPEDVVTRVLAKPFWPLQFESLTASIQFKELSSDPIDEAYDYRGLSIRWCPVHHSGGCSAYRFDEPTTGASLVIATDLEWGESRKDERELFLRFCKTPAPPQCLVFDGHFEPREYPRYTGWGHSTWEDGVTIAREAGAERLIITHHSPDKDDATLQMVERKLVGAFDKAVLARQGMEVTLGT